MTSQHNILRTWKWVGYLSFIGLVIGILTITAMIPLSFVVMGEFDIVTIAIHSGSLKMVAYWTIGIGGVTIVAYVFSGLATLVRKKSFVILMLVILVLHLLATLAIMIWGIIPTDSRKKYLKESWEGFNTTTANLVQNHFSCCGFESASEWNIKDDSCYAVKSEKIVWPQGCYDRVMSASVPASTVTNTGGETVSGSSSWNNFIAAYSVMFIFILLVDLLNIIGFSFILKITDFSKISNCSRTKPRLMLNIKSELNVIVLENLDEKVIPNPYLSSNGNVTDEFNENGGINILNGDVNKGNEKIHGDYNKNGNGVAINGDSLHHPNSKRKSFQSTDSIPIAFDDDSNTPWYSKISHTISHGLESAFFWLGLLIGMHPKRTIVMSSIVTVALCFGLLQRRETDGSGSSFLPDDLPIIDNFEAYTKYFTTKELEHKIIVEENSNVIAQEMFQKTWELDKGVKNIKSSTSMTFDTLCLRYNAGCGQESLFELWSYNDTDISTATDQSILDKIKPKNNLQSPYYGGKYVINNVLGGQVLTPDEITAAKAHMLVYRTNFTFFEGDWQDKFIELAQSESTGLKVYVSAAASFSNETKSSYEEEIPLLFAGFALVFLYIAVMTGKFSLVRHRIWTAMLGVLTAGMAMGAGIGFSASLQLEWTVLHLIGPFLIMGIGVDDMFILLQTWTMIDEDPRFKKESVEEKAGHVLKTAGVSISVTSITDLVAFAVGASSSLKVFESFSIYTSICIILLFFFQCTFFMACTVLDQKRREQNRDACLCWHKYGDDYEEGKCAKREIFQWIFENVLGYALEFAAVRIVVMLLTLGVTGVMAWGFYQLQVAYNPDWYLPSKSYLLDFNEAETKYFSRGMDVNVYIINADFYNDRDKLELLYDKLYDNKLVDNDFLKSWYHDYLSWPQKKATPTSSEFYMDVNKFTNSSDGNLFLYDVIFNFARTTIDACKIRLRHIETVNAIDDVEIMDSIRDDINEVGLNATVFPYTGQYFNLEITKIIAEEVYRNIGITLACVFVVVLPTIASLQMSIWVGLCVVFTIVDVAGTMHFAGLYIESSTIITLLLTVGLAVDYAAHIGHKFLTLKGSRTLRMRVSLSHVGPAVFNGGFSTFLALSLLAGSSTYSYKVFFTVFTCVVGFGLWNGLFFLPSVLGFIGPHPHRTAHDAHLSYRAKLRKTDIAKDLQQPENGEIKRS